MFFDRTAAASCHGNFASGCRLCLFQVVAQGPAVDHLGERLTGQPILIFAILPIERGVAISYKRLPSWVLAVIMGSDDVFTKKNVAVVTLPFSSRMRE